MGSRVVKFSIRRNSKIATACTFLPAVFASAAALALPPDFTGSYQILQSRTLSLTANGRGYVIQDGALVSENVLNHSRAYCRAGQSKFDEANGRFETTFAVAVDGFEHALLKTIPAVAGHQSTTVECISELGFSGALDLAVALGRIVELTK
jgi:hypothetical protein